MFFFSRDDTFKFEPISIESAYLAILHEDLVSAKNIFLKIDSPRSSWGVFLIENLSGYVQKFPTYFEIRNFLEIDLDFLLKNKKTDYVQLILGIADLLAKINQETYKYIARVMYENQFYKTAKEYLEKSKDILYNDPELHFILAKYHYKNNEYSSALLNIKECLKILPDYYPAKIFQAEIIKRLA
jgi:tetratricopeptide (TPR) repeat protein